ncbi:MAG: hypothetical protein H2069_10000 [Legionella sp.]|nr:hypothetical protein [Legionella sp.]
MKAFIRQLILCTLQSRIVSKPIKLLLVCFPRIKQYAKGYVFSSLSLPNDLSSNISPDLLSLRAKSILQQLQVGFSKTSSSKHHSLK